MRFLLNALDTIAATIRLGRPAVRVRLKLPITVIGGYPAHILTVVERTVDLPRPLAYQTRTVFSLGRIDPDDRLARVDGVGIHVYMSAAAVHDVGCRLPVIMLEPVNLSSALTEDGVALLMALLKAGGWTNSDIPIYADWVARWRTITNDLAAEDNTCDLGLSGEPDDEFDEDDEDEEDEDYEPRPSPDVHNKAPRPRKPEETNGTPKPKTRRGDDEDTRPAPSKN